METQTREYLVLKHFLGSGTSWKRNDVIPGDTAAAWGPVRLTQLVEQRYLSPLVTGEEKVSGASDEVKRLLESLAAENRALRERIEEIAARRRGRPKKTA